MVNTHLLHAALVHSDVGNFFDQVSEALIHLRLHTVFVVEGSQVVLVLDLGIVDIDQDILFLLLNEVGVGSLPLICGFLLEDSFELFLSFFRGVERSTLVHTFLANSTVPSQHNIQVSVGVVNHLHLVESVIAIVSVFKVNLGHVGIKGPPVCAFTFKVNFVLFFTSKTDI